MNKLTYIQSAYTENTGGGCMVDFLTMHDGRIIAVSDDEIGLYESLDDFYTEASLSAPCITIPPKKADSRKFVAYWGKGYTPEARIVERDFFNADRGYEAESQDHIDSLMIGQSADLSSISGVHFITRVA